VIQKTDLEQQIVLLEGSKLKRLEPLRKWVFGGKYGPKCRKFEQLVRNEVISAKKRLEPLFTRSNLNCFLQKKPFYLLAETVVAVRDLADENARCSRWWRRRELNPRPKQTYQPRLHAYSK